MDARDRRPLIVLVLTTLVLGAAGMALILRGSIERRLTAAQEHERVEEREHGLTLRALQERGGRLTAPPDAVAGALVEPPFPGSKNTDGQAGSGGRAVAYRSGGRDEPSAAARDRAPEALLWRTGFGSWEPTMGISPNGTVFTSARNSNVDPGIARSKDGGRTWDRVTPPGVEASLDPYIWVDPATGSLFSSDIDAPPGVCVPISRSDDDGDTWRTVRACGVTDHQNMFGGPAPADGPQPQGYPNVVYYCAISGGTLSDTSTITECLKSLDGGATFLKTGAQPAYGPKPTGDGSGGGGLVCNGAAGHGVVGPDGSVYLPRAWCDDPFISISRDQGATWKQVKVASDLPAPSGSHETGVAVDRDGTLYYVWVAGKDHHPYLSISRDGGETWSAPKDILPPGVAEVSAFAAHIDVGDPGKIAALFMGTTDAEVTPETHWNAYVVESVNALDDDPTFYAASVNDPATNALWKGNCGDFRCGNIGDFMDVVVGPDGTASTALVDSCPIDDECITDLTITTPRGEAVVGQVVGGPSLRSPAEPAKPDPAPGAPSAPPASSSPDASPGAPDGSPACAVTAGFRSVGVRPRGRGAGLVFKTRAPGARVDVDVFQQSRGRRVIGERLVARFRGREKSVRWDGRANRRKGRLSDGYYFVRFRTRTAGGVRDTRRVTLRRSNGRFSRQRDFYRRATCDLVPSFKLERPVFGGVGRRSGLEIAYRVSSPATVTVTVRRGASVVRRFAKRPSPASRTVRLKVPLRGLGRGVYTVRLEATSGGSRVVSTLVSRRL